MPIMLSNAKANIASKTVGDGAEPELSIVCAKSERFVSFRELSAAARR
jgi:hypothetical protein